LKPYYDHAGITIYHGDCTEIVPRLELKQVFVLTDPPYGIKVDTSWLTTLNVKRGKPANVSDDKLQGDDGILDISFMFEYDKRLIFGYPYIQDPDGTGWLVWDKQPGIDGRNITSPVEMAVTTLWKGFDVVRAMWGGYYRHNNETRYAHPTQKPLKIFKRLINKYGKEDDTILDPFMGSGTTLVAAKELGRKAIGIEIEEKYCEIAVRRLAQEVLPLGCP
jgi:DNA modification methylase